MAMFDWYRPHASTFCPWCDAELREWQGKCGPCALFVWEQGKPHPTDQLLGDEEIGWTRNEFTKFRLPDSFTIYSYDCPAHRPIKATCRCIDGVWCDFKIAKEPGDG